MKGIIMLIKLKREWMGSPKGAILDIVEPVARRLIEWGTAVEFKEEKKKAVGRPPRDKMVTDPATSKAASAPA